MEPNVKPQATLGVVATVFFIGIVVVGAAVMAKVVWTVIKRVTDRLFPAASSQPSPSAPRPQATPSISSQPRVMYKAVYASEVWDTSKKNWIPLAQAQCLPLDGQPSESKDREGYSWGFYSDRAYLFKNMKIYEGVTIQEALSACEKRGSSGGNRYPGDEKVFGGDRF